MIRVTINVFLCAVGASLFAAAASQNLLSNSSFEAESAFSYGFAQNWKMNDPDDHGDAWGSASRENWRAKDGQYIIAIRGTWANAGSNGGVWQEAQGRGNQSYRLKAWFYADVGWAAETQEMKLEFWNWDRTQMLGSAALKLENIGESWTERELIAVSPEGTEWVRAVFNVSGAGPTGALQIDDVSLEALP
ncbi:MAG: hypothetical protein NZ740_01055 [Kiritimatiellae bacterium]|nr:hypothetical protein [Kiritimatiellia bacterium]MDW8457679.1 hypothetical protein [Verrucomicrobiota bacterium]